MKHRLALVAALALMCLLSATESKPIMIEIKDCLAAEIKNDHALFEYLRENGFSAANNKAPLVDFTDPHTRVTRFPDCLLHIRSVLAKPSHINVNKNGEHTFVSQEAGKRQISESEQLDDQIILEQISSAYQQNYVSNLADSRRRKREASLFEKDDIEGDGVRDLRSASTSEEKKVTSEKVITLSFDSRVRMYGEINQDVVLHVGDHPMHQSGMSSVPEKVQKLSLGALPWYLDRLTGTWDADNAYSLHEAYRTETNVTSPHWVFVVGTGIRSDHQEFIDPVTNRSIVKGVVFDAYPGHINDRNGHETLVASLIAGRYFNRGPTNVALFDVVVLDRNGEGWLSDITSGIASVYYWLRDNNNNATSVSINMSLGGAGSQTFSDTLRGLFDLLRVHFDAAIFVSAGNDHVDACSIVPASLSSRMPNVITVASSNRNNRFSSFSNYGPCVTVIAPGEDILGASNQCPSCYAPGSGTSFAAPLVHRLFVLARSINLTDIWLSRNIPPIEGEFCQPSEDALHVNINQPEAHWLQDNVCMNGAVLLGHCPVDKILSESQVCVDGTIDDLSCLNGTWIVKYICDSAAFVQTSAPSTDPQSFDGDVVHPTYLQSDLTIDYLMRYNSFQDRIAAAPANTPNRAMVMNDNIWIGSDDVVYSYLRTFSMLGNNKPGLLPTAELVEPVLPKNIPIDPQFFGDAGNIQQGSSNAARVSHSLLHCVIVILAIVLYI